MIFRQIPGLDPQSVQLQSCDLQGLAPGIARVDVLRWDLVHPVVSGNKIFKLSGFLENALQQNARCLITFGGAWSNHLVATAYCAHALGLNSIGIIRGEKPEKLSPCLQDCLTYGMELRFISRKEFDNPVSRQRIAEICLRRSPVQPALIIPMGGASPEGLSGVKEAVRYWSMQHYSHICCAVGTGTMMAGLLTGLEEIVPGPDSATTLPEVRGYLAARDPQGEARKNLQDLIPGTLKRVRHQLVEAAHGDAYAKITPALHYWMQEFEQRFGIPLDRVYTGKLFYRVFQDLQHTTFPPDSRILIIHSGGLQGNRGYGRG